VLVGLWRLARTKEEIAVVVGTQTAMVIQLGLDIAESVRNHVIQTLLVVKEEP